ncbi:Ger(x)C family spore germination protein [Paenibacillus senegalensis]|uniref:Ger(x)C family spore germination protein n=1 Tax=Paenibacillus senegalensis TaxID=1465766 RepID=UPI00028A3E70|nr:Ger(x)C family spore germination protein [Paenibacillus senegalensis]
MIYSIFRSGNIPLLRKCAVVWIVCALLSGCWDSREIEELSVVLGVAIDVDQDILQLTYQHLIAQRNNENEFTNITTVSEDSIQSASREQAKQVAHAPLYNFIRLILISDQALTNWRIDQLLDPFIRSYKPSRNSVVMVIEGSAKDALKNVGKHKDLPSVNLRDISKNSHSNAKIPEKITLGEVSIRVSQGADFVIQRVHANSSNRVAGGALINGKTKKFAGWLSGEEVSGINWMLGNTKGTVIKAEAKGTNHMMTFEVDSVRSTLTPYVKGEDISFTLHIKTCLNMNESRAAAADFLKESFLQAAKKAVQEEIKETVHRSLNKLQKKEKADVIDFRTKLKVNHPKTWDRVKDNWPEMFSKIPVEVLVDVEVERTGAYSKGVGPS